MTACGAHGSRAAETIWDGPDKGYEGPTAPLRDDRERGRRSPGADEYAGVFGQEAEA